jgi:Holliday junction resolvase
MSVNRRAAKRDANEGEIVDALETVGASVTRLSAPGVPDILCGYRGDTFLLEIKNGKNDLTEDQVTWHRQWQGRKVWIVRTVQEALEAIGAT